MNEFKREEHSEESFDTMHGIKPRVYRQQVSGVENKVKLMFGGKEVFITEKLSKGLTDTVILEYVENKEQFKSVYAAEQRATELLKGIDNGKSS